MIEPMGFRALPDGGAERVRGGGIIARTSQLVHDMSGLTGRVGGVYLRLGEAFYTSGGLTGRNPWRKENRF